MSIVGATTFSVESVSLVSVFLTFGGVPGSFSTAVERSLIDRDADRSEIQRSFFE